MMIGQPGGPIGHTPFALANDSRIVNSVFSIKHFGALMDGSDDGGAIQDSLDTLGYAYIPSGTATVLTPIVMPSHSTIYGDGIGRSIIAVHADMSRTDALISNASPTGGARVTNNLAIRDLTIDGALRVWPSSPTSGYLDDGYLIWFRGVDGYRLTNVEAKNHGSFAVQDRGSKGGVVTGCWFHDNGNVNEYSPAFSTTAAGNIFSIKDITRASPPVLTVYNHAANWSASATSVRIRNLSNFNIPDGDYAIVYVGTNQFSLTGEDTSGEASAYEADLIAYCGYSTTTATNFFPTEDLKVENCTFEDNAFHHFAFSACVGGKLVNSRLLDGGESAIFSTTSRDILIEGNTIDGTTIASVIGDGVEMNTTGNGHIVNNKISNTATYGIGSNCGQNLTVTGNTIINAVVDAASAGGRTSVMHFGSYDQFPGANIHVANNTVLDTRATTETTSVVYLDRSGTAGITSNVYDVSIKNNHWGNCGLASSAMIAVSGTDITIPNRIHIAGNTGHSSQAAYVQQVVLAGGAATGVLDYNIGFVPSCVLIEAHNPSTARVWGSRSTIVRDPAAAGAGAQGTGVRTSLTPSTGGRAAALSNEAYLITTDAGTSQARATFQSWNCQSTKGIGFSLNITLTTIAATYVMTCFP